MCQSFKLSRSSNRFFTTISLFSTVCNCNNMLSSRTIQSAALKRLSLAGVRYNSVGAFNEIPLAPPDKILGIAEAYNKDTNPKKINLGVGAYRDDSGRPIIFPSVKKAEEKLLVVETEKEYTGITGNKNFQNVVKNFIFNNSGKDVNGAKLIEEGRIVTAQTISGTGSLRVIADFLNRFYKNKHIIAPKPTWANHIAVFNDAGISSSYYTYYDTAINGLDFAGLKKSLLDGQNGAIVLLHACCHNPTGMDLTSAQWEEVLQIIQDKQYYPLIDMAYQGFASGNPYKDISLIRRVNELVVDKKIPSYALCQSFAKNMGLYGERTGSISIITESKEDSTKIESQLKKLIRPMYSSPPIHGSKIVEQIFADESLYQSWLSDLDSVVGRLNYIRNKLYEKLDKTNYDWEHLTKQRGMFIYTGLSKEQMVELREKYSVYATEDGRFSISGVNEANVDYLADAMNKVISK